MTQETANIIEPRGEAISHLGALWQTAHWFAENECDAEALVMNTYVEAFRSRGDSGFEANLKIQLFRTLIKMLIGNIHPKRPEHMSVEFDNALLSFPSGDTPIITTIPPEVVVGALKSLPLEIRAAMVLSIFERFTYPEIAAIMRVHRRIVGQNICRGYALMRKKLLGHIAAGNKTYQLNDSG